MQNPDWELFTDGSGFIIKGERRAGYAVVSLEGEIEARSLPANTSAQKAELIALTQALELSEGKRTNVFTDSKDAFGVIHAHGTIWKERGLL